MENPHVVTSDGKSRKKKKMARSVIGNRATNGSDYGDTELGSDHRPIVRSVIAPDDRSYDQSWGPTIDRTINRFNIQPIVRSIVAPDHRSYGNRGTRRSIVRSIVTSCDRSYEQSCTADPRSSNTGGATMNIWWCNHV